MPRMTRDSWADLALKTLAEHGPEALTVASLCARAQKTKGSFYHHFKDHNALLHSMCARWEQRNTHNIIRSAKNDPNTLHTHATQLDPSIEQSVRRIAARNPTLQPYIQRVDTTRINHLTALRNAQTHDQTRARLLAEIEYAAFLGAQQLGLSHTHMDALYQTFEDLIHNAYPSRSS